MKDTQIYPGIRILNTSLIILTGIFILLTPLLFWYKTSNPYLIKDVFFQAISILIVSLIIVRIMLKPQLKIRYIPFYLPMLLYILLSVVSVAWAWGRYEAFSELVYRITGGVFVFLIIVNIIDSGKKLQLFFNIVILTGVLVAVYGIPQSWGIELFKPEQNWQNPYGARVMSTLGNPNFAAGYLLSVFPLSFSMLLFRSGRIKFMGIPRRIFYGISTVLIIWCLIATQTRGTFISLILGIVITLLLFPFLKPGDDKEQLRKRFRTALYSLGITAIIVLIIVFSIGGITKRISTTKRQMLFSEGSIGQRYLMWTVGLKMARSNPFIGLGVGMYRLNYPEYQAEYLLSENFIRQNTHARHPHNEFIEVADELGFSGLIIFLWFIITVIITGWYLLKKLRRDALFPYIFGSVLAVFLILFHNMISVVLRYVSVMMTFWAAIGFIAVIYNLSTAGVQTPEQNSRLEFAVSRDKKPLLNYICLFVLIFLVIFNILWTKHNHRVLMASKYFSNGLGLLDFAAARQYPGNMPENIRNADRYNMTVEVFKKFYKSSQLNPAYLNNYYRMGNCFIMLEEYHTDFISAKNNLGANYSRLSPELRDLYGRLKKSEEFLLNHMDDINGSDAYFKKAIGFFEQGNRYKPAYAEINLNMGIAYAKLSGSEKDNLKQAETYLHRALSIEPINLKAYFQLLDVYNRMNNIPGQLEVFKKMIHVLNLEESVDLRNIEYLKLEYEQGRASYRTLLNRYNLLVGNAKKLAIVYERYYRLDSKTVEQDYENQLKKLRIYISESSEFYKSLLQSRSDELDVKRIENLKQALANNSNDYFWSVYSQLNISLDNAEIEDAISVLDKELSSAYIKGNPDRGGFLINHIGNYLFDHNKITRAQDFLSSHLFEGRKTALSVKLAFLYYSRDSADRAKQIITDLSKSGKLNFNQYMYIYEDKMIKDHPRMAADFLRFASDYDTNSKPELTHFSGVIYIRNLQETELAATQFKKYIELKPDDYLGYNSLGSLYYLTGELEAALKYWEQALKYNPENRDIKTNIQIIKQKLNQE